MTPEEHQAEHIRLHRALDELLACYLSGNRFPIGGFPVLRTSIHDDLFLFLKWSHDKTLVPSPLPEEFGLHSIEPKYLVAQTDDPELLEWLAKAKQEGGGFVASLAQAGLVADHENYPVIRFVLMAMRKKYPAYEPSDQVKQEIRERTP